MAIALHYAGETDCWCHERSGQCGPSYHLCPGLGAGLPSKPIAEITQRAKVTTADVGGVGGDAVMLHSFKDIEVSVGVMVEEHYDDDEIP